MAKSKKKKSGFGTVMGIICGILIAGNIIVLAVVPTMNRTYCHSGESYLGKINADDYYQVVVYAQIDRRYEDRKDKDTESVKQFYAVADYVTATMMYKAYKETGDTAKTEEYAAKIGEAQKSLGNLDFVKEDINSILDVK